MIHRRKAALFGILMILLFIAQPAPALRAQAAFQANANNYECVSTGAQGVGGGAYASISADGRFVVFESYAPDLAAGHLLDSWDVFLRDRLDNHVERVSTRSGGEPVYNPGDYTSSPVVSASGRYVAFMSRSEYLVENDGNSLPDIFYHDRDHNTTHLVSVGLGGAAGNGQSFTPAISPDGRFVAFQSAANDLVPGDTNNSMDIFVRDMLHGVTERVSITSSGEQGFDQNDYGFSSISISNGGRYVAFSYDHLPIPGQPVAFMPSVYLRDRQANTTRAIAVGEYPRLSSEGRYLVFISPDPLTADDLNVDHDVYLLDLQTDQFERISLPGPGRTPAEQYFSGTPDVTNNGRYVVFVAAGGLTASAPADTYQVYLRDRSIGATMLVSRGYDGSPANQDAHTVAIAANGAALAFTSSASNLILDDTNGFSDVFVVGLPSPAILPESVGGILFLPVITR